MLLRRRMVPIVGWARSWVAAAMLHERLRYAQELPTVVIHGCCRMMLMVDIMMPARIAIIARMLFSSCVFFLIGFLLGVFAGVAYAPACTCKDAVRGFEILANSAGICRPHAVLLLEYYALGVLKFRHCIWVQP